MNRRKGERQQTEKDGLRYAKPVDRFRALVTNKFTEIFCLDLRSLALLRILLGVTVILDILDRATDLSAHYTDEGIMPRTLLIRELSGYFTGAFSIHLMSGSYWWMAILFSITYLFAFGLLIGYRTKICTFAVWFLISSVQYRHVAVLHSGDDLLRVLLFFSLFVPTDKMFSVDAFLKACAKDEKHLEGELKKYKTTFKKPLVISSICAIALMSQILVIYATAYFHKTGPEWRKDRTATWYALQMASFRLPLGDLLAMFPNVCKFLTFSVIHWQLLGPWLYLSPVLTGPIKAFVSMGFASMHLGFAFSLRLEMFNWITLSGSLTLLPNWFWETLRSFLTRERLTLRYDPKNKLSVYLAHFVEVFFLIPDILVRRHEGLDLSDAGRVEEGGLSASSSYVVWLEVEDDIESRRLKNFDALEKLVKCSLLFWPLARLSFFRRFKRIWTRLIINYHNKAQETYHESHDLKKSRNSSRLSSLPLNMFKKLLRWSKEIFVLIIILFVLIWNLRDVHFIHDVPQTVKNGIMFFQLDQSWRMFAPSPPDSDFWYNMIGVTSSGKKLELFHNGGLYHWKASEVSWKKPESLLVSYKNHRWVKYFENGLSDADDYFVGTFAQWVCDQYNKRQIADKNKFETLTIYVVSERYNASEPFAAPIPLPKEKFWEQNCFPDEE